MKKVIFLSLLSMAIFVISISHSYAATAHGWQKIGAVIKGTRLGGDPIVVNQGGVIITDVSLSCADRGWISAQNGQVIYKFSKQKPLKNYIIRQPGNYNIYPTNKNLNCTKATVKVTYKPLSSNVQKVVGEQTVVGQKWSTKEKCDPIVVGQQGITLRITKVEGETQGCLSGVWIVRNLGERMQNFRRFNDWRQLNGFRIIQPGTYYLQPVIKNSKHCTTVKIYAEYTTP